MNNPHESENFIADNENSLKSVVQAITLAQGQFRLILLHCNYGALRDRMVQRLRELSPIEIRELDLPESVNSLYNTIKSKLGDEVPQVLMVLGLESVSNLDKILAFSNAERDKFGNNFPFPLLLWVNDEIQQKLIRLAPDFESWATSIEFASTTNDLIEFIQEEANSLFAKVLEAGADQFLDNASINFGVGAGKRFELESALKDLQMRGISQPEMEASQQFIFGWDAYACDEIERSQDFYKKSLKFWQQEHVVEQQACLLFHLGLSWRRSAILRPDGFENACNEALSYYQQCVEVLKHAKRPELVAKFTNALGEILQKLEKWDELEDWATKAVKLHKTYFDSIRYSKAYGFIAEVALAGENWQKTQEYAQKALNIINENSEDDHDYRNQSVDFIAVRRHYKSWYRFLLAQAQIKLLEDKEALQNLENAKEKCKHEYNPQLYIQILELLQDLYFKQRWYLEAFEIKQERSFIEWKYGFRSFIGVGRIESQRQSFKPVRESFADRKLTISSEIVASGRNENVKNLIDLIIATTHKMTVIYGSTGVGKSSLLVAGLIPQLSQTSAIHGRTHLPVLVQNYTDWIKDLGTALGKALQNYLSVELSAELDSLEVIVEQLQKNEQSDLVTILIFDQFEEFFFNCPNPTERKKFWNFLHDCLDKLDVPYVKVILSLREDYLFYLLECDRLEVLNVTGNDILNKEKFRYYLDNFSQNQAKKVFQELAKLSSFYIEEALIERLVSDLARDLGKVRPIELQVVGAQLQAEKISKLSEYKSTQSLIENFLETIIQDCGPDNELLTRSILYSLTDENLTRPVKNRNELFLVKKILFSKSEILDNNQFDLVLKILVESGLVSILPGSPKRYQLIHDYFVTFIRKSIQEENRRRLDQIDSLEMMNKIFTKKRNEAEIKSKVLKKLTRFFGFATLVLVITTIILHQSLTDLRSQIQKKIQTIEKELSRNSIDGSGIFRYWKADDKGFEIVGLQSRLINAGYKIEITGIYDEKTLKAVWHFQEQFGLYADGIVGPETFLKLYHNYSSYGVIVPIQKGDTKEDILKRVQRYENKAYILELKALDISYVHIRNIPNLSDAKKKAKELRSHGIIAFAASF
jgi:DNA replication protein DnaC